MTRAFRFPGVTVEVWADTRTVRHTFADGAQLIAAPQPGPSYEEKARFLGYGGDDPAFSLCVEHEVIHHVDALWHGKDASPTLWSEAHPGDPNCLPLDERYAEEDRVLDVQRRLNSSGPESETPQLSDLRRWLRGE
jgi:hypothetical protein